MPSFAPTTFQDDYSELYNKNNPNAPKLETYIDQFGRLAYRYKNTKQPFVYSPTPPLVTSALTQTDNNKPDDNDKPDDDKPTPPISHPFGEPGREKNYVDPNAGSQIGTGVVQGAPLSSEGGLVKQAAQTQEEQSMLSSVLGGTLVGSLVQGLSTGSFNNTIQGAPTNVAGVTMSTRPGTFMEAMMGLAIPGVGLISKAVGKAFASHMNDLAAKGQTVTSSPGYVGPVGFDVNTLGMGVLTGVPDPLVDMTGAQRLRSFLNTFGSIQDLTNKAEGKSVNRGGYDKPDRSLKGPGGTLGGGV
jgi:hypothetical protein